MAIFVVTHEYNALQEGAAMWSSQTPDKRSSEVTLRMGSIPTPSARLAEWYGRSQ